MGFHRNRVGIVERNLIFAFDDQSKRCHEGTNTIIYNLVDLLDTWSTSGTVSRDGEGYFYYNGTNTIISGRSCLSQSDLTKNIFTGGQASELYTLEAWIRMDNKTPGLTTSGLQIIGNNSSLGVGLQLMDHATYGNVVNFGYRSNDNIYGLIQLAQSTWYHVVGSRTNPGTPISEIYVNGVKDTEKEGLAVLDVDATTAAMNLGQTATRITGFFKGNMPIVRIYNDGLSAAEVLQNFNAQKKRFGY